jgi:capsular polysaccharide biosynthesis protein
MDKNINLKENSSNDEENLTLSKIISILKRRTKIFSIVTLFFFSGSVLFTVYQRITNPIYRGTFTILTKDPVESDVSIGSEYSVALKTLSGGSNINFPTLKIFLKSALALSSLADEMNLPVQYLEKVIYIEDERKTRTEGNVINVSINVKDYELGKKLISNLSDTYLQLAVEMRRKRLTDGLEFLNSQLPGIKESGSIIKSQLSDFRKKNTFIDPNLEGLGIKNNIKQYNQSIKDINLILANLEELKNDVESRRLTSVGFKERFGGEVSGLGFEVKNANSPIIQEALKLEEKLEMQKGIFTDKSLVVQNIQNHLDSIRPSVIKSQLQAIDSASKFYKDQLSTYKFAIDNLKNEFVVQPDIIKALRIFSKKSK